MKYTINEKQIVDRLLSIYKKHYARLHNEFNTHKIPIEFKDIWPSWWPYKALAEYTGITEKAMQDAIHDALTIPMSMIVSTIGEKECLRFHHINNLNSTDADFELWYAEQNKPIWK